MYRGEFEGRMRDLLNEIKGRSDVILFIDEIHNMVGAGSTQGSMDVANLLKPALARGELRLIGATTYAEYKKNILSDSALDRRFQNILIVEPDNEQTLKILRGQKNRLEKHYQLMITPQAIETAVLLSQRFIHDRKQPDKALDLLDRACASQLVNGKQKIIKPEHVAQLLAKAFGQKAEDILNASGNRLEKLSAKLNNEIIGQTQAIENICKILRRNQLGLSSSTGPVASLIFCGPSGSGKTFCAQALAKEYFLDKDALIKIDMSEFGEKHSISRLIGAPAGYVGYREASVLVDGLRKRPTSVVLFDEIEKAHPDIFNILLQILDSGYLTDGSGEKINFQNAIIVMTTNCGGQNNKSMGFEKEASTDYYKDELKKFLRPEILNRLDALVPFVTLNENDLKIIADDYLKKIRTSAGKFKILSSDLDIAIANSQKEGGVRALIRKLSDLAEKELTK
jgi:ATP-dependent Clp protease ATP-binding subunit ClpC